MEEKKGFFGVLFDFNFTEFLAPKLIKVLFVLGICGAVLSSISFIVGGFAGGPVGGIIALLLSPLVFLLIVMGCRVWLELIMLGFKIANNTSTLVKLIEEKKDGAAE